MHVVVFIIAEATADEAIFQGCGFMSIAFQQALIFIRCDGIVGGVAVVEAGVFTEYDGLFFRIGPFGMEVSGFMNTGERDVFFGEVDDGITLEVFCIDDLFFEVEGPPTEPSEFVVEEAVDGAAVNETGVLVESGSDGEKVCIEHQSDILMRQDLLKHGGVAVFGNALPLIEEIVFDIVFAEGESIEHGGGEFAGIDLPLLYRIVLKESFVEVVTECGEGLFFEVGGMGNGPITDLIHEGIYFEWPEIDIEEMIDGLEVDGELVDPVAVVAEDLVAIGVEGCEAMDIVPYFFIGGMEDMCAIGMVFDAGGRVYRGMAVATDMSSFFYDQHRLV